MMEAEGWDRVKRVLQAALDVPAEERTMYLRETCGDDHDLRTEVESLLVAHQQAGSFAQRPAIERLNASASTTTTDQIGLTVGQQIGAYEILTWLDAGGMGDVYRARDKKLGRDVAIKTLPGWVAADPDRLARFEREARVLAALNHPHICTVHDLGREGDLEYLVMEYIDGETLAARVQKGPLSLGEVLRHAGEIADALAAAHARGVIHRDVKPANIMITTDGRVKMLDFGLAKLVNPIATADSPTLPLTSATDTDVVLGTVAYTSPEQAEGRSVDARSDVFSFGAVFYEMLAGRPPFAGDSPLATLAAILKDAPAPLKTARPDVPADVVQLLEGCLAKDREARPTADAIVQRLAAIRARSGAPHVDLRAVLRRPAIAVSALLVVLAVAAGTWWAARDRAEAPAPSVQALAVLPLENLSGDPSQEYFADGMTEELITRLSKIRGLTVISRASAMQFKGVRKPLPEIAKQLGVQVLVAGSVAHSTDRVRITAQLVDANDRNLWADRYDRPMRDVLAIQADVAAAIAREIRTNISPQDQKRLVAVGTVSSQGYDAYLRGKFHAAFQEREHNAQAIESFERAIAADPQFAAARAELGRAYAQRLFYYSPGDAQLRERAFVEIERALTIDPDLAVAHEAKGGLLWQPWNRFPHERAIAEYRRAIDLNPSADEARHQLATVYLHVGLLDEGLREIQEAIRINPDNRQNRFREGVAFLYSGRYRDALGVFSKTPADLNPLNLAFQLADTLIHLGRGDDAAVTLDAYLAKDPTDPGGQATGVQAMLEAEAGRVARVEELVAIAQEKTKGIGHAHHTMYHIARAYALLGRTNDAVMWLRRAANDGFSCYTLFANDPLLNRIRTDRVFQEFLGEQRRVWEGFKKLVG